MSSRVRRKKTWTWLCHFSCTFFADCMKNASLITSRTTSSCFALSTCINYELRTANLLIVGRETHLETLLCCVPCNLLYLCSPQMDYFNIERIENLAQLISKALPITKSGFRIGGFTCSVREGTEDLYGNGFKNDNE